MIMLGPLLGFNQISYFTFQSKFQISYRNSICRTKFLDASTKVYSLLTPPHEIPEPLLIVSL